MVATLMVRHLSYDEDLSHQKQKQHLPHHQKHKRKIHQNQKQNQQTIHQNQKQNQQTIHQNQQTIQLTTKIPMLSENQVDDEADEVVKNKHHRNNINK